MAQLRHFSGSYAYFYKHRWYNPCTYQSGHFSAPCLSHIYHTRRLGLHSL
ncbi:Uncharacterised protein [Vibrio cholerae]|nr:Uncharacterised protein [Vibrio cholerae]